MDLAKLAKGITLVGAAGTGAIMAPVDVLNALTQLIVAAVGLWEVIRAGRNKPQA